MKRSHWVFLLLFGFLVVAVIPLRNILSTSSSSVDSSVLESIRTKYAEAGSGKVGLQFVPGEVLVRFGRDIAEGDIVGLRVAQGADEVYVSRFSGVRRWRM